MKEIMLFIEFLVSQISKKTLYLTCNASPTAVNGGVIQDETRRECQHRVNTERLFLHLYAVVSAVFYWQTALLSLNSQAHNNGFPKVILKTAVMVKCRSQKRQGQREEPRLKFSQVFFEKKKTKHASFKDFCCPRKCFGLLALPSKFGQTPFWLSQKMPRLPAVVLSDFHP